MNENNVKKDINRIWELATLKAESDLSPELRRISKELMLVMYKIGYKDAKQENNEGKEK